MIPPYLILAIIFLYFTLLMVISWLSSRNSKASTYFDGNRKSPWLLVAFGMIGSGISAVSLVSIPGGVGNDHFHFLQFILGTIVGYIFIAFVLIPIFHRLKLVSIYHYLEQRFGRSGYLTGSMFFFLSQSFGASFRLLLSVKILQTGFLDAMGVPYPLSVCIGLCLIWLYTHKSGIKTIIWTDALQSFFLVGVIVVSILVIKNQLGLDLGKMMDRIWHDPHSNAFNWDWSDGNHFFKQFVSGILITIALVGLDQSMIQKTLTVSNLSDARKNVLTFSFFIAAAQTLFLFLGLFLYAFAKEKGIVLPMQNGRYTDTDKLYPMMTLHYFGMAGAVAFFIGVVASTFATIDSCITAMTTSFSYDIMSIQRQPEDRRKGIKSRVLLMVNFIIFSIVMLFWNSQGAIINTIFKIAGFTYGPLLGLYLLGIFTNIEIRDRWIPLVCILSAGLTWLLDGWVYSFFGFDLGFMNILLNAMLTVLFLLVIKKTDEDGSAAQHI